MVMIHSMLCVLAQITNGRMQRPQRNWTPLLSILRLTCLPRLTWLPEVDLAAPADLAC